MNEKQAIQEIYDAIIQAEETRDNKNYAAWDILQPFVWGVIKGRCEKVLGIPTQYQHPDEVGK